MKKFRSHTVKEYLEALSVKAPVPGGGSVAALTGALAAGLLSMVANYSIGKGGSPAVEKRIAQTLARSEKFRKRFLELVDLDAQAYLRVVKTRKASPKVRQAALSQAAKVPLEISRLAYEALQLAPFLVEKGNKYLLSDVEVAVELLSATFKSGMINVRVNQSS